MYLCIQVLILVVDNRKRQNSEGGNSWSFCRADLTVASFQTGLEALCYPQKAVCPVLQWQ